MKNNPGKSTLFISDIHLSGRSDPRQEELIRFLDDNIGKIDTLIIGGDFFDFWIGYSNVLYSEYLPVLSQLEKMVRAGIKLVFYEGNHDFYLGPYFKNVLRATVHSSPAPVELEQCRTWLCHGDQLDPGDVGYRILRWFLRTPVVKFLCRIIHPSIMWRLGCWASDTSRERLSHNRNKRRDRLRQYSLEKFREGFDVVISGHLHDPLIEGLEFEGKRRVIINLGDWLTNRSVLWYSDGVFEFIPDIRDGRRLIPTI